MAELVSEGLANKTISDRLDLTVPTVKFHVTECLKCLGLSNRVQLARWWIERVEVAEARDHHRSVAIEALIAIAMHDEDDAGVAAVEALKEVGHWVDGRPYYPPRWPGP